MGDEDDMLDLSGFDDVAMAVGVHAGVYAAAPAAVVQTIASAGFSVANGRPAASSASSSTGVPNNSGVAGSHQPVLKSWNDDEDFDLDDDILDFQPRALPTATIVQPSATSSVPKPAVQPKKTTLLDVNVIGNTDDSFDFDHESQRPLVAHAKPALAPASAAAAPARGVALPQLPLDQAPAAASSGAAAAVAKAITVSTFHDAHGVADDGEDADGMTLGDLAAKRADGHVLNAMRLVQQQLPPPQQPPASKAGVAGAARPAAAFIARPAPTAAIAAAAPRSQVVAGPPPQGCNAASAAQGAQAAAAQPPRPSNAAGSAGAGPASSSSCGVNPLEWLSSLPPDVGNGQPPIWPLRPPAAAAAAAGGGRGAGWPLTGPWLSMCRDLNVWPGVWDPIVDVKDYDAIHTAATAPGADDELAIDAAQVGQDVIERWGTEPASHTSDIPPGCDEELVKLLRHYNLYQLKNCNRRSFSNVSQLVVKIRSIIPASDVNVCAWIEDPTAVMAAVLLRSVVDEHGHELGPGSVMLLRDISVFCMGEAQLLNIMPRNVARIWGPDTQDPRRAVYNDVLSGGGGGAGTGPNHDGHGGGAGDGGDEVEVVHGDARQVAAPSLQLPVGEQNLDISRAHAF